MKNERLLDVERVVRKTGKALVHVKDGCPDCGSELDAETVTEAPLLRHGGYGAARATTRRHCRCGYVLLAEVSEVHPNPPPVSLPERRDLE